MKDLTTTANKQRQGKLEQSIQTAIHICWARLEILFKT